MSNRGDIDIDTCDRGKALEGLVHVPASIIRDGRITKHNTGVYFHAVPIDPVTGLCSIGYDRAENMGCFKMDVLNVGVYEMVRDEEHLLDLMRRPPDWNVFQDIKFVSRLFHLGNHGELTARLRPQSVMDIAMILALIRPGKRHLQEKCARLGFGGIANEIWHHDGDEGYVFRKSHAVSYAFLVIVHANLLIEQDNQNKP